MATLAPAASRDDGAHPQTHARAGAPRLQIVDLVRGLAIAGVVIFHLVWDLELTGLALQGANSNPWWILFGRSLATSFMFLVGVSLVLAHPNGVRWKAFGKRIAMIGLAALVITVATYFTFPQAFIFFGILHAIVFASLLGALLLPLPALLLTLAGTVIVIAPELYAADMFNSRWLAWIGFSTISPPSNDLVPVFPWVGVTLLGMGVTKAALAKSWDRTLSRFSGTSPLSRAFTFMGRHSLAIYLLHQPVLLGLLIPLGNLLR
ncbi:heparan-alpha-glucosaminide N-acetyltransferase [Nitratireductor basaltis]|uniref:Heparan-alpha-glucosaminide N-acetyltransferase catalytic domain-containing protein n=1 Tax=Nitratireductor basaltis TaxID=472175 RepID=A0A084U593_9HYPH|nr:heparan-alpha-glucosaminide N-acetyltransferase [Nitratireductor basaltis]KFB08129.1 hypothetical protein EL18_03339 [Nitratireductor basaltis]